MSFFKYLKDNKIKMIYIISIFFIVNTIFLTTKSINGKEDLIYLNILLLFLSIIYISAEYFIFKKEYNNLYNSIYNNYDFNNLDFNKDKTLPKMISDLIEIQNKNNFINLRNAKEELNNLNDFITLWIHEIKLPISVIELISERIEDLEEYNLSKDLRIEIERINFLLNQVLYASRIIDFSKDLNITEVNLNNIINSAIKDNKNILMSKNISIDFSKINSNIYTDKKWISFVINQIINNSAKYTGENGQIKIYFEDSINKINLIILDNGIGIAKSDINRVFDKSFTGKNGTKFQKSTGMGLYLSKKISTYLNFDINIFSEENKYTKVIISFDKMNPYFNITKM